MSSIYVGKLNQRTPESEVHECFSRYGKIKRIDFKLGFAFIFYDDEISCEEAIKGMRGNELDGHTLVVELSRSNKEFLNGPPNSFTNRSEFRISVAGLDQNTSWQDLKDWARNAGSVKFADVLVKNGEKFGVIEYENMESCDKALSHLPDKLLSGLSCIVTKEVEESATYGHTFRGSGGNRNFHRGGDRDYGNRGGNLRGDNRYDGGYNRGRNDYRNDSRGGNDYGRGGDYRDDYRGGGGGYNRDSRGGGFYGDRGGDRGGDSYGHHRGGTDQFDRRPSGNDYDYRARYNENDHLPSGGGGYNGGGRDAHEFRSRLRSRSPPTKDIAYNRDLIDRSHIAPNIRSRSRSRDRGRGIEGVGMGGGERVYYSDIRQNNTSGGYENQGGFSGSERVGNYDTRSDLGYQQQSGFSRH